MPLWFLIAGNVVICSYEDFVLIYVIGSAESVLQRTYAFPNIRGILVEMQLLKTQFYFIAPSY